VKAIELIAKYMSDAVKEGQAEWEAARARLGGALVQPSASTNK
jgi:hypothetical protein